MSKDIDQREFTVIMPVLDREDIVNGFPKALESIFNNTLKPDQVIIIVDGLAGPNFKNIIDTQKLKYKFDIVWTQSNVGIDKALNIGINSSRNNFIFRADGDDINKVDRFKIQLPYLIKGYDLVGSYIDEYDNLDKYIATRKVPITEREIRKMIPFRNPFNHMTVAFNKSAIIEVGCYPELFLKGDYGLWANLIAANKKVINLDISLVNVNAGSGMIKRRGGFKYVISEFYLQKHLLDKGLTNIVQSILVMLLRSTIFLSPSVVRTRIYKIFLRKKNKSKQKKLIIKS